MSHKQVVFGGYDDYLGGMSSSSSGRSIVRGGSYHSFLTEGKTFWIMPALAILVIAANIYIMKMDSKKSKRTSKK
jgi:hypothetical protein